MIRAVLGCVGMVLLVVCTTGAADKDKDKDKNKDKDDVIVGTRWVYTMTDENKKVVEDGFFRGHEYKLYKGGNQIGTYDEPSTDHVIMTVTEGELKGKTDLRLVEKDPPKYRGELTRPNGKKYQITVIFRKK